METLSVVAGLEPSTSWKVATVEATEPLKLKITAQHRKNWTNFGLNHFFEYFFIFAPRFDRSSLLAISTK